MAFKLILEKFYENMEEATIGKWLKQEGEWVKEGEPLVEIVTEKVTFELESPFSGVLRRIVSVEKSVVPCGYVIALMGEADEPLPDVDAENEEVMRRYKQAVELALTLPPPQPRAASPQAAGERVRATPAARRLARQHGLDLVKVAERMKVDVVTEKDVLVFLKQKSG